MNVLLTCAGRRNYLVGYFIEAVGGRGSVFAADVSPFAPALHEADQGFLLPAVEDPSYAECLLALCREKQVSLLVPLHDLELPVLCRERERFAQIGTTVLVSSPEVIDTCFDKWATAQFLAREALEGPGTYRSLSKVYAALNRGEIAFPLVVKPRWGSASIGIVQADHIEAIESAYWYACERLSKSVLPKSERGGSGPAILIQERLAGEEYGLDIINDFSGNYLCTWVRKKLCMRAGETDRAEVLRHSALELIGEKIGRSLKHTGILDCDVFVCDEVVFVLEMNPRFGGGYPFSHAAGANLPAILIALVEGRTPEARHLSINPSLVAAKCDRLVVVSGQSSPAHKANSLQSFSGDPEIA